MTVIAIGFTQLVVLWTLTTIDSMLMMSSWHVPSYATVRLDVLVASSAIAGLLLARAVSITIQQAGAFAERVLLVGTHPLVTTLIDELEDQTDRRFTIIGVVDDATNGGRTPGVSLRLGSLERLGEIIDATGPSRIVIALADRQSPVPVGPLLDSRVRGVPVEEGITFFERVTGKLAIEALPASSLILSDGFRHSDFVRSDFSMTIIRAASFVFAFVGLLAMLPLLALIALAIRFDSPGPIFFIHSRVGRGGRPFGLVKFRTMHVSEHPRSEWVRDNADRITPVGRWLRRFRLDELPQFVNVLRGEMNLVGPRPHPVSNYKLFLENIPYYALRSAVRPGITGWAQVRYGYANGLEEETEKMRYDLYYIKHRSLWLDLRILIETFGVLLDRKNHESVRHAPLKFWNGTTTGVALR